MSDLHFEIGYGASALDQQQEVDRLDGYAVASGYGISPGTGLAVDVDPGEAVFGLDANGDANIVSSGSTQSVALADADPDYPRKDVIYVDSAGDPRKETGIARAAQPSDATRFNTYQPEPYSMHDIDGVVLAEVWVGAGETSVNSSDIRDRRLSATAVHQELVAESLSVTGETTTDSLSTDEALIGSTAGAETPAKRPYVSAGPATINVPGDYSSIQAAVLDTPLHLQHSRVIRIDPGYYDEDLFIPKYISIDKDDTRIPNQGKGAMLTLRTSESPSDPTNPWEVNSIYGFAPQGRESLEFNSFKVRDISPHVDEPAAIALHGNGDVYLHGMSFGDVVTNSGETGTVGIMPYAADVKIGNELVDVGADNLHHLIKCKGAGPYLESRAEGSNLTGSVQNYVVDASRGSVALRGLGNLSWGESEPVNTSTAVVKIGGYGVYGVRDIRGTDGRFKVLGDSGGWVTSEGPNQGIEMVYDGSEVFLVDSNGNQEQITTFTS